jgi:putative transposase
MPFLALHAVCSFLLDLAHVLTRSEQEKSVELVLLRQQLRLYERKTTQPRPSRCEKVLLASLAARLPDLSRVALVFSPATLLRWHREIVKRKWTFDNRPRRGRPPISAACAELMLRLARENPRWGYGKIQGELRKLGHRVSRSAIKRLLRQHGLPPAPERGTSTWRDFVGHYRDYIVACDFFTVDTLCLQRLYVLCFLELGSRRLHLAGCTAAPDAAWVTQQARQFSWQLQEREPGSVRYLLHDRDGKYAAGFDIVFASEGIEVIRTPVRAPNANAYAERVIRSIRAECLDRLLILNQTLCWL